MDYNSETTVDTIASAVPPTAHRSEGQASSSGSADSAAPATDSSLSSSVPEALSSLELLATEINEAASTFETHSLKLGRLILRTREHFPSSKTGRNDWGTWLRENIRLKDSRIRELVRIAKSSNPGETEKRLKEGNRNRQKRSRDKDKAAALHNADKQPRIAEAVTSSDDEERVALAKRILAAVSSWTSGAPLAMLQSVEQMLCGDPDNFPKMLEFLVYNKAQFRANATNDTKGEPVGCSAGSQDAPLRNGAADSDASPSSTMPEASPQPTHGPLLPTADAGNGNASHLVQTNVAAETPRLSAIGPSKEVVS